MTRVSLPVDTYLKSASEIANHLGFEWLLVLDDQASSLQAFRRRTKVTMEPSHLLGLEGANHKNTRWVQ